MRYRKKADLLKYLKPLAPRQQSSPELYVKILDGAAYVDTLEINDALNVMCSQIHNYYIAMALSGVCLHVVRRKVPHNMIFPNDLKLLEK